MKIKLLVASLFIMGVAFGQDNEIALRHIKGIKSLDLGIGKGANEINYEAGLSFWHGNKFFMHYYLNYERAKFDNSDFTDYTLQIAPNYSLFKIGDKMYLNLTAGLAAGLQKIKEYKPAGDTYVFPEKNVFIYGLVGGANLEFYVNKTTALVLEGRQFYFQNYDFGTMKYQINGTVRFILN